MFARGSLKKTWRPGMGESDAVRSCLEALYDAADDDSATGGPDVGRRIWPRVAVVDVEGVRLIEDDELAGMVTDLVAARRDNPGGAR